VTLLPQLTAIVGAAYVTTDADVLAGRVVDHTGRYRGRAQALVRPGSAAEVAAVLRACRDAGAYVTVQGGRTSLVAGTVPEHDDVLLSTERLSTVDTVDADERRIRAGAGATCAAVQHAAAAAGLVFGVDLASRDSATVGGMASTNAGGLRTVRYGNMREQILGLDVALPDGSLVHRHSHVRSDNTGYDLTSLFVGAEGTLGVITGLDLRLYPVPAHRVTAVAGFDDLDALIVSTSFSWLEPPLIILAKCPFVVGASHEDIGEFNDLLTSRSAMAQIELRAEYASHVLSPTYNFNRVAVRSGPRAYQDLAMRSPQLISPPTSGSLHDDR
jgi:FAD/FMN-containing dehydrogenase